LADILNRQPDAWKRDSDPEIFRNLRIALGLVGLLWLVFFVDWMAPMDLRAFGLRPRNPDALGGIVLSPFLHGNLRHIMGNSGALFVLLLLSLSLGRRLTLVALIIILLVGGGFVWLFAAPNTIHIGASGVIFGLLGFLLFLGVFQRRWTSLMLSVVVGLIYGGMLFSLFRFQRGVSFSGHLFGFLSGVLAAWLLRKGGRG
jgi:membrane associated rhomboid family serine protease